MPWSKRFYDPIILPDGRKLLTLRDAADWQGAMETLLLVAERDGPEMLARIAVMKALNGTSRNLCQLHMETGQGFSDRSVITWN